MTGDRRYDDREVGQILKRVAELHEREGETADARGMTRGELEQVVEELGISKALVARATSELAVQDVRNVPVWWLGGKTYLMFEEVVDGGVDEPTLTQMLEVMRRAVGDPGHLGQEGGARIWLTTSNTARRIHLTVVEHAGRTTLRLEERMDASVSLGLALLGGFAGFVTGMFAVVLLKAVMIKALLVVMMGAFALIGALAGWVGGRAIWRRRSAEREAQVRQAFAEIVALAESGVKRPPDDE